MTIRMRFMKEIKIIAMSAVVGLLLTCVIAARTYVYSETTQSDIARNVIRFHVLAHSDSDEDQALKQKVRDGVLQTFKQALNASNSVEETRQFLTSHLDEIKSCAESIIRENGYDYPVSASVTKDFFPTKVYGDVVFPPGDYEALRIVIGNGEGRNWWCVMFPPLCYVDITRGIVSEDGKQQLKLNLPEEEYKLLTHANDDTTVKVKFKIVEWWQNRKQANREAENTQTVMR